MSERDEIKRLKKENHELKKKLYKLETRVHESEDKKQDDFKCFGANNYFSFLLSKIKRKSFYSYFEKATKYFRNSLWITSAFRIGLLIYQYLQAGAFFILYTAVFIMFIPITLAVSLITLAVTLFLRERNGRVLLRLLDKDIAIIIPESKEAFNRAAIEEKIAEQSGKSVLIVTPFFLKKKGVGDSKKMFVCYRKERDNVYILRRYFFFYFRKRMKKEQTFDISEVFITEN